MLGYWFYKYEIEDKDVAVVDYESMENARDIYFPVVTLCIINPFLERKFSEIDEGINGTTYLKYLRGELWDEQLHTIAYQNVTIDMNDYIVGGYVGWKNGSSQIDDTISFESKEVFSGFFPDRSGIEKFAKCFSLKQIIWDDRTISWFKLIYDKQMLSYDLGEDNQWMNVPVLPIGFSVNYPGQFLIKTNAMSQLTTAYHSNGLQAFITSLEILKRRNSRKRKCTENSISFDRLVLNKHIESTGCIAPYLGAYKMYPKCNTTETVKKSMYLFEEMATKYYPRSCKRISKMDTDLTTARVASTLLGIGLRFPDDVKIITQSKEVDIHTLIGNMGGYIGLFLGNLYV